MLKNGPQRTATNAYWLWLRQHWLLALAIVLGVLPTLGFVLVSGAILVYIYWPVDFDRLAPFPINPGTRHIVVIAHGVGDTPASWATPLRLLLEEDSNSTNDLQQVLALDWQYYAGDILRCSVNGKRIGEALGLKFAQSPKLESLHLIGHSCGAFVVLGLCNAIKSQRPDVQVQTTYLDPVSIYGGLFWNYGITRFGACADFSEAFIDHEDTVPGSNQLLPSTHTFDVTHARKTTQFAGQPHVWPTFFYQQLIRSGNYPSLRKDPDISARYPKNILENINQMPN